MTEVMGSKSMRSMNRKEKGGKRESGRREKRGGEGRRAAEGGEKGEREVGGEEEEKGGRERQPRGRTGRGGERGGGSAAQQELPLRPSPVVGESGEGAGSQRTPQTAHLHTSALERKTCTVCFSRGVSSSKERK